MTTPGPVIGHAHCILIEGTDARRFAQAQLAGNLDRLAAGHWQWNAWLTPQGRVRALMHLADAGEGNLLGVLRGGDAEAIRDDLARFRLRAEVALTVRTCAARADAPLAPGVAAFDDGTLVLGYGSRSLRLEASAGAPCAPGAAETWRLEDIRAGWPVLPSGEPQFLPPALGLEHLLAVSFDKGCYPGQEIVARLRYRGGHKQRLYHLQAPGEALESVNGIACLDAVAHDGMVDALTVGPLDLPRETLAAGTLRVVTAFDP